MLSLLAVARAQTVPALVNYQGRLANPDGSPLPTADYTLTFNLFDATTNGARVWGPQMFDAAVAQGHGARVPVVQGWFNVMLGPVDTNGVSLADAFNGTSRYVEVTVSNRPPIAPRQQILTTPFAFQAANSAKLAGYDWSAVFGTNNPVAGTIPFSKLAQREVGTNVGVGGIGVTPPATDSNPPIGYHDFSVTLAVTGRPVFLGLIPGVPGQNSEISGSSAYPEFYRDGNLIGRILHSTLAGGSAFPPSFFWTIDFVPAPGTYQFSIRMVNPQLIQNVRLVAFEL